MKALKLTDELPLIKKKVKKGRVFIIPQNGENEYGLFDTLVIRLGKKGTGRVIYAKNFFPEDASTDFIMEDVFNLAENSIYAKGKMLLYQANPKGELCLIN